MAPKRGVKTPALTKKKPVRNKHVSAGVVDDLVLVDDGNGRELSGNANGVKRRKNKKKKNVSSGVGAGGGEVGGIVDNLVLAEEGNVGEVSANTKGMKRKKMTKKKKNVSSVGDNVVGEGQVSAIVDNLVSVDEGNVSKVLVNTKGMKRKNPKKKHVSSVGEVDVGEGQVCGVVDNLSKGDKGKKRKMQRETSVVDMVEAEGGGDVSGDKGKKRKMQRGTGVVDMVEAEGGEGGGKSKKNGKKKSKDRSKGKGEKLVEKREQTDKHDVYHISAVDEDCSKGMKKWIKEYHDSRPGLKILEQKIDDFIIAHEARLEEDNKERKLRAEEDGWTVVEHHKGRKKTTDAETGITVGSVAQIAVEDKMAKKKNKGVGLQFYQFQKKEARRNEILALQSKFEQDKKRIEQLRAARKFRPY